MNVNANTTPTASRTLQLSMLMIALFLSACGGGSGGGGPELTSSSATGTSGSGASPGGTGSSSGSTGSSSGSTSSGGMNSSTGSGGSSSGSGASSGSSSSSGESVLRLLISYEDIDSNCITQCRLDYANSGYKPVRFAEVQILDQSTGQVVDTESPLFTDAEGKLVVNLPVGQSVRVRVIASSKVNSDRGSWDISIFDNQGSATLADYDLYSVLSQEVDAVAGDIDLDLQLPSGWTGEGYSEPRLSAPFAILDSMIASVEYFAQGEYRIDLPGLKVFWSIANRPDQNSIGTSFYSDGNLWILGDENVDTDEFDDHILVHEWSHFLLDALSRDDSMGGDHGFDDLLDARVAYSEGLATALACLVLRDEVYRDTSGPSQNGGFDFNCEQSAGLDVPSGWFSESAVIGLVYDVFDEGADESDRDDLYLSITQMQEILFQNMVAQSKGSAATIFSFLAASLEVASAFAAEVMDLANAKNIGAGLNTVDVLGTNESNGAQDYKNPQGNETQYSLPLYTELTVNAEPVDLCQDTLHGQPNKISNRRLLFFRIEDQGTYKLTVNAKNESEDAKEQDPDFLVYSASSLVFAGESSVRDKEEAEIGFDPGSFWMEVYDFRLLDSDQIGVSCQSIALGSI